MSRISLFAMGALFLGVAACSQQEEPAPAPAPAPVVAPDPVFTGKP